MRHARLTATVRVKVLRLRNKVCKYLSLGQVLGTGPGVILTMDLIPPLQQPIDIIQAPSARIDAHQRALTFALVELQGVAAASISGCNALVMCRYFGLNLG